MNNKQLESNIGKAVYGLCLLSLAFFIAVCLFLGNSNAATPSSGFTEAKQMGGKTHTKIVKVKSTTRYKIGKDKEIQAVFEGLKPEALELGLNDAVLFGRPTFEKVSGKKIRIKVEWHTISAQAAKTASLSGKLPTPLRSRFLVSEDEKNIEPGTVIPAKGNFETLTETFLALKDRINKKQSVEIKTAAEEVADQTREASTFSPGTNSSGIVGGDSPASGTEYDANLVTTTIEDCYPRIAELEEKLYLQSREVKTNQDGSINSMAECMDTGQTITATKIWGEDDAKCPNIHDFGAKLTYFQYKAVAMYNDVEIVVRDCFNDQSTSVAIQATQENCGWRHDFDAGISVPQEELYYMMGPIPRFITACQDGPKTYAHYETQTTCSPVIDNVNNLYFPKSRIAFTLDDGTMDYATACRVQEGPGYTIQEEYCDPKYEHDFIGGTSYYTTRDVYVDGDGVSQPLSDCLRSSTASFAHQNDLAACPTVNDDVAMQTIINGTLYIDTPDDGIIELEPCHQIGVPLAYVRMDDFTELEFTSSTVWDVPLGVNEAFVTVVGAGNNGDSGTNGSAPLWIKPNFSRIYYGGVGGTGGRGGAAGQTKDNVRVPLTGETSVTVTVGTQSGEASSFGTLLTASGGVGYSASGGTGAATAFGLDQFDSLFCTSTGDGGYGTTGQNLNYGGTGGPGGAGGLEHPAIANASCYNGGGGGGGAGGDGGYGSLLLAGNGTNGGIGTVPYVRYEPGNFGSFGTAGTGYGAGGGGGGAGGGAAGVNGATGGDGGLGGANAPGFAKIGFTTVSYVRGDGTIYIP